MLTQFVHCPSSLIINQSVIVPAIHSGSTSTVAISCYDNSVCFCFAVRDDLVFATRLSSPVFHQSCAVYNCANSDSNNARNVLVHAAFCLIQPTSMMTMIMMMSTVTTQRLNLVLFHDSFISQWHKVLTSHCI